MKTKLTILLFCLSALYCEAQTNIWIGDSIQSEVTFSVRNMLISKVQGKFTHYEVDVITTEGSFENAQIEVLVIPESIDTKNEAIDQHLLTEDYLNTAIYDSIHFVSTNFKIVEEETYFLEGNLTILGTTKPVKLSAKFLGYSRNMYLKKTAEFEISGIIDRSDFNMPGTFLVGKKVKIKCHVELVLQE